MQALSSLLLMAGGPAHMLPGAVAPIGPWSASKTQMKILCSLPKSTSRICLLNPRRNRLFAPKTQQAVWVRPLQTKIMCKPPSEMDGTNSGSSALEGLIKSAVKAFVDLSKRKLRVTPEDVGHLFGLLCTDLVLIKEKLENMQTNLDDAESKLNPVEGSEDIRNQVSFEIRDVIEDFDTSIETTRRTGLEVVRCVQRLFMSQQLMIRSVQRFFSLQLMIWCVQKVFSLHLMTRFWVTFKIFSIYLKIPDIFKQREFPGILLMKINEITERRRKPSSSIQSLQDFRRSSAEKEEPEVVFGLIEEIKTVKEQLIYGEESPAVISIVGMGGSGKTTLAKKVYHDVDVKDAFECHAWICLSQQFEIKDVMMRMIKVVMGLSGKAIEKLNVAELREKLCDHLKKKKYLVVIDDIWSMEAWDMLASDRDKLKPVLPLDGKDKSRVMLTTRNKKVALYADSSSPLVEMPLLVGDEPGDPGWDLFMKKIFPKEKDPSNACPPELVNIAKQILAKCGGLPLVILAIGGILAEKKKIHNEWSKVFDSVDGCLTKGLPDSEHVHPTRDPKWCMRILALSYWDLPYDLKPCFLYFGLFPEDFEIDPTKLIRLWIAEGFIRHKIHPIIEDDAEEYYLEKLIQRSMIQVSWKQHGGSVGGYGCRIHDLFREFAVLQAKKNNFFVIHNVDGTHSLPNNVRRLALHRSINGYHPTSTLRSILDFCGTLDISGSEFRQAKFLRVMSQNFMHHPKIVESIEELECKFVHLRYLKAESIEELKGFVHLRYLELVENIESLPSSLGDLDNLQTLVLRQLYVPFYNAISNLKQLRHLEGHRGMVGVRVHQRKVGNLRVKDLTNLQTLSLTYGHWIEDGFGNLTNLRNLTMFWSPCLNDETLSYSIEKLRSLRSLTLCSSRFPRLMPFTNHVHLYKMILNGRMEKLPELPPNLIELTLFESRLEQDDISKLEKLQHLKILHLANDSYESEKMICSSGGFPRLEILKMSWIRLEEWIIEEGAMPSLKSVVLSLMSDLKRQTLPERVRALVSPRHEASNSRKKRTGA